MQLIAIGKITNTHGHKGELRVLPLTDFPDRFYNLKEVYVSKGEVQVVMHPETVRRHKQFFVIKFIEIPDMNEAEKWKAALLQVTRQDLVDLPADSYYIFDIIGLSVFTETGELLGKVTDVMQTGANDIYVVEHPDKPKPLLIPALKQVVLNIDLAQQRMIVKLLPGLLEI